MARHWAQIVAAIWFALALQPSLSFDLGQARAARSGRYNAVEDQSAPRIAPSRSYSCAEAKRGDSLIGRGQGRDMLNGDGHRLPQPATNRCRTPDTDAASPDTPLSVRKTLVRSLKEQQAALAQMLIDDEIAFMLRRLPALPDCKSFHRALISEAKRRGIGAA